MSHPNHPTLSNLYDFILNVFSHLPERFPSVYAKASHVEVQSHMTAPVPRTTPPPTPPLCPYRSPFCVRRGGGGGVGGEGAGVARGGGGGGGASDGQNSARDLPLPPARFVVTRKSGE